MQNAQFFLFFMYLPFSSGKILIRFNFYVCFPHPCSAAGLGFAVPLAAISHLQHLIQTTLSCFTPARKLVLHQQLILVWMEEMLINYHSHHLGSPCCKAAFRTLTTKTALHSLASAGQVPATALPASPLCSIQLEHLILSYLGAFTLQKDATGPNSDNITIWMMVKELENKSALSFFLAL